MGRKKNLVDLAFNHTGVIKMEINPQGKDSVTVTNAYVPTSRAEDEKVDQFYDDIVRAMADSDSKYKSLQEISM